jgi:hypothetical protein
MRSLLLPVDVRARFSGDRINSANCPLHSPFASLFDVAMKLESGRGVPQVEPVLQSALTVARLRSAKLV